VRALALAATTPDDIRNAAGLASLTLALIGYFTSQRAEVLKREKGSIGVYTRKMLLQVAPEALLLLATVVALVAMAPLLDAFDAARVGRLDGTLPTLFTVVWFGFCCVAVFQIGLIVGRLKPALKNRRDQRASAASPSGSR
jgi:hypothetical protein